MQTNEKRPRITMMGEEIPWDSLPDPKAVELEDYFKPVRLSSKAIDQASKVVPPEHWIKHGIHTWLESRANHVFRKLSSDLTVGTLGLLKYKFEYDSDGAVLAQVFI